MKKTGAYGAIAVLALVGIITSSTLDLSDFLSGFILGVSIVAEVVSIYLAAKSMKKDK